MQRLHTFDLTGHELAKQIGYELVKFPMEFNPRNRCVVNLGIDKKTGEKKTWTDPRTEDKEPFWEARFDQEARDQLRKDLGPYGWAGQEQQEPIPEGGAIFKVEWFKSVDAFPIFDVVAMSVDCAFTDEESSSYVVIQVWGFKGPNAYLLENIREHLSFVATEEMIKATRAKWAEKHLTPNAILIENKANGPAIISRLVKVFPGIIPCEPRKMGGSKFARASSVSPFVAAGNVFVPKDAPWLADFYLEATNFPKYNSDDQVDALSQALWWYYLSNIDVKRYQEKARFLAWAEVKLDD
jgi:predicted phage terminase large subunit-like protein